MKNTPNQGRNTTFSAENDFFAGFSSTIVRIGHSCCPPISIQSVLIIKVATALSTLIFIVSHGSYLLRCRERSGVDARLQDKRPVCKILNFENLGQK